MGRLTRRGLRSIQNRWERDLAVLEAAFPGIDLTTETHPEAETIRNLATAIGEIDGIITNIKPLTGRRALSGQTKKQGGEDG